MRINFLSIILLSTIFLFSACSSLSVSSSNEGAKATNAQLAASYIERALASDQAWLTHQMFISKYLENQKLTPAEFEIRVSELKSKWDLNSHPLAALAFQKVNIDGDDALVTFRRTSSKDKDYPTIKVELFWTGSRWSIVDDNFLGKGELFDTLK